MKKKNTGSNKDDITREYICSFLFKIALIN